MNTSKKQPDRIRFKRALYIKAAPMAGLPGIGGGHSMGRRQKVLSPPVKRVMPSNPDPLFAKAAKALEEMEKVLEKTKPGDKEQEDKLDLRLLIERYQMPSLRLLVSEWTTFHEKFLAYVKRAKEEIKAARGQIDEF